MGVDEKKDIVELGKLNELAYEDLTLSNNTTPLWKWLHLDRFKMQSSEFPEGSGKVAWDRLENFVEAEK